MTHPSDQRLHAWMDGESGDEAASIAAHVASCARCAGVIDGARRLGEAMRTWASDATPEIAADLASTVLKAGTNGASRAKPTGTPSARPAAVRAAPRRYVRAVVPAALVAIAAAAVILFRFPPGHGRRTLAGLRDAGTQLASVHEPPHGASVVSVESAKWTFYSVMEIPGSIAGATTAVVWIEAKPVEDTSGVE